MNPVGVLRAAQAAGINVTVDGNDLVLTASARPPAQVLDLIARNKKGIVDLLHTAHEGLSRKEWQELFDERAAIGEFEGGLPREQAESEALSCCMSEWLDRNPVRSIPGCCIHCGQSGGTLRRYLIRRCAKESGNALLHPGCVQPWDQERRAKAVQALVVLLPAAFQKDRGTNFFVSGNGRDEANSEVLTRVVTAGMTSNAIAPVPVEEFVSG
jgi:hypothetical protein